MSKEEILEKVQSIFREVLDDEEMTVTKSSKADDHEDWDSITFVEIISEIEDAFRIQFKTIEIENFQSVGDMVDGIVNKVV